MRVGILNDLSIAGPRSGGHGSGTELTVARFQHELIRRGHEVTILCPEYTRPDLLGEFDLLIAKNVTAFNAEQLAAVQRRPYVAWPSDYAWSKWRLYFAFQESHRRLKGLEFWRGWFTRSVFNAFSSPLHRDAYWWVMPGIEGHPTHLVAPPVDVDLFKPSLDGWEANTACTINGGLDYKGLHNNLTWASTHPDVQFTFIGAIRDQVNLPGNAKFAGFLPWNQLADKLGRTETYVELPKSAQPFNQSCVQALLACKRVVTNGLMGAASWDWFKRGDREAARDALRRSLPDFVTKLEGIAG